jgi:hypothetical protein
MLKVRADAVRTSSAQMMRTSDPDVSRLATFSSPLPRRELCNASYR